MLREQKRMKHRQIPGEFGHTGHSSQIIDLMINFSPSLSLHVDRYV